MIWNVASEKETLWGCISYVRQAQCKSLCPLIEQQAIRVILGRDFDRFDLRSTSLHLIHSVRVACILLSFCTLFCVSDADLEAYAFVSFQRPACSNICIGRVSSVFERLHKNATREQQSNQSFAIDFAQIALQRVRQRLALSNTTHRIRQLLQCDILATLVQTERKRKSRNQHTSSSLNILRIAAAS